MTDGRIGGGAVGVVGVGNMGLPIAERLLERGFDVHVRDIDAARQDAAIRAGATAHPSAAALGERAHTVIVIVVDAGQCDDVLFGRDGAAQALAVAESLDAEPLDAGQGDADSLEDAQPLDSPQPPKARPAIVLCPTIAPDDTERIAARLAALGIDCIDAPMSGGPARARDGSMSLMVACADAAFERRRSLLGAMSSQVFRVGTRPGDGARTKLVNNLLAAVNLAGAAEALALAEKLGLDLATTLSVIEQSSGQSWIGSDRMRRAFAGDSVPRAHTTLLAKDSRLAIEAARSVGFDAAIGAAAMRVFAAAGASERYAGLDDSSLLAYLRSRAMSS